MNKPSKTQIGWGIVAVAAILATLFFGVNYPVPPAPEEEVQMALSRPVQLRDVRILQDLAVEGSATVGDDLTVTDDLAAGGDVTITGGLSVTGGVTGTNVLTTGNQSIAGNKTFTGNVIVDGTSDLKGNIGDSAGVLTVADNVLIDGQADAIQLTVQGHSTQNTSLLVLEQSNGTDVLTVSGAGNVDVVGTLQYGANNLYPVGFASSGQQLVYGTTANTGTLSVPHGLTTVTFCQATLGEDPETGAGDAAFVTVAVSANACTVKAWQDAWNAAATETDVVVHWLVIGAP